MSTKKLLIFLTVGILFFSGLPFGSPQPTPVTVYGFVKDSDGASLPDGVTVVVKNTDTGDYSNVTTSGGTYLSYISASLGDTIRASCSYLGESGGNTTTVTDSLLQWLNLTLEKGPAPKQPPVADFTWSPYNPVEGETVSFSDQSSDPDGEVVSWSWSLGDGTTSTSRYPSNSYMAGTYMVTLVVTDNDGLSGDKKDWVVVRKDVVPPPEKNISIPPLPPPVYPEPPPEAYTIPQMYEMLGVNELSRSSAKITIVVIDTGYTPRTFTTENVTIDMTDIEGRNCRIYTSPLDDMGHGTWTNCDIEFAKERWVPNARHISIKALDEDGVASVLTILEAFDMAEDLGADIISISAGARGKVGDALDWKVQQMRRKGILVVAAAGNYGPDRSSIVSPALSKDCVAVGSVDPMHTIPFLEDDEICPWSSRGPVDTMTKPNLVCGGESIVGPWLSGARILSGTSTSTPTIAGSAMIIMAENNFLLSILEVEYFFWPGLRPKLVEESIEDTCYDKGDPYSYGFGIPDFKEASSRLHFLCLLYILIPLVILISIIIVVIVVYWHYKKK